MIPLVEVLEIFQNNVLKTSTVSRETYMNFDIIIVGGGHAGIEAANIAAKKKLKILLITNHLDLIGQM